MVLLMRVNETEGGSLRRAIADLPECAVVFPSTEVAASWRGDSEHLPPALWTSEDAKGLDLRHVLVPLVGETIREVRALCDGGSELGRLRARTLIDGLRVAVSRATDTVVLVVDAESPEAEAEIEALAADIPGFAHLEVEELLEQLREEFGDALERADAATSEGERLLYESVEEALRKARQAVATLGAQRGAANRDVVLRQRAHRLRGTAALLRAMQSGEKQPDRLFKEANRALHAAELPEAAKASLLIRNVMLHDAFLDALHLSVAIPALMELMPEVALRAKQVLLDSMQRIPDRMPATAHGVHALLDATTAVSNDLRTEFPAVHGLEASVRRAAAHKLVSLADWRRALSLLQTLDQRDWAREGQCLEALETWGGAAEAYRQGGSTSDAIRMYRRAGDFDSAATLAEQSQLPEGQSLRWAADILERAERAPEDLTRRELDDISARLRRSLQEVPQSVALKKMA
jgi:tetratricopeptide (TPR) repeat protein